MKRVSSYLRVKKAKKLPKSEYTPEVKTVIEKTKKYFPFISDVFDVARNYIVEASFDGLLTHKELQALSSDKALAKIDFVSPKKLQLVWAKN